MEYAVTVVIRVEAEDEADAVDLALEAIEYKEGITKIEHFQTDEL